MTFNTQGQRSIVFQMKDAITGQFLGDQVKRSIRIYDPIEDLILDTRYCPINIPCEVKYSISRGISLMKKKTKN